MQWIILIFLAPYVYLITKIYLNLAKIQTYYPKTNPGLSVSVIIPCRNQQNELPLLLSDIAVQNLDPDLFEVIIVDDNSTDLTFEKVSGFTGVKNFKVINNAGRGKKMAIRTGIEASAGTLIITTDADCRAGKNWLKTIASFQAELNAEMIICPVRMDGHKGFFERFQELEFLSLQGITAGTAASGDPAMCNGANLAFPREVYLRHKDALYDELLSGDDVFLLHSIKKNNGSKKIMWLESADTSTVTTTCPSILSFLRQRIRWISKAPSYTDRFTKVLAIVTFVTILSQAGLLGGVLFFPELVGVYAVFFLIKSVPDYLLLSNTSSRYDKKRLMRWFLPSQFIYPFYVLAVVFCSMFLKPQWRN
jgi:cellulose synthase/poly-beta-1,6-N-acetylglucosamine synthase-like glycosyltransferase